MQYLMTEAEYNNIRVDKEEFERRVKLATEEQLKRYRGRIGEVIKSFFADRYDRFNIATIDFRTLKDFSDKLHDAAQVPKDSCDKPASSVVE